MSDRSARPQSLPAVLEDSGLASARLLRRLGDGRRSTAYLIRWQDRECALKVYNPAAVAKHVGRHPIPLARYEYLRNRRLYRTPGLQDHIAQPIAFLDNGPTQAFVQEYVPGTLFEHFREHASVEVLRVLTDSLHALVALAHGAGVFDLDLHPNNVMVVGEDAQGYRLKLFDFNNIPVHERLSNPLTALACRLRLIRPESRDRRRLHLFTDPPGYNRFGTRRQR